MNGYAMIVLGQNTKKKSIIRHRKLVKATLINVITYEQQANQMFLQILQEQMIPTCNDYLNFQLYFRSIGLIAKRNNQMKNKKIFV